MQPSTSGIRVLLRGLNANHKQIFSKGKRKVLGVPGGRREETNAETLGVNEQNQMPSWVMGRGAVKDEVQAPGWVSGRRSHLWGGLGRSWVYRGAHETGLVPVGFVMPLRLLM